MSECVHHWVLDAMDRETGVTKGQCQLCGKKREFSDAADGSVEFGREKNMMEWRNTKGHRWTS